MAPIRGLVNPFQFFNLLFAFVQIFLLLNVFDQTMFCSGPRCDVQDNGNIEILALLMTVEPTVMVIGIIMAKPRFLRFCKVYHLVEKSLLLCSILLLSIFTSGLFMEYISNHILTDEERISMALFYSILSLTVLPIAQYTIFRNWMINGAIKSVEYDIGMKGQEHFRLSANSDKSVA